MGGKYREYVSTRKTSMKDLQRIHPVWRGVGFAMMVLIPVISWAAAEVIIQQNAIHGWFPFPYDLLAGPGQFLYKIVPDELINIKAMLFVAVLLVLYAVFTLVSFLANSMFGVTARKDPYYVPPVRRRPRRSR